MTEKTNRMKVGNNSIGPRVDDTCAVDSRVLMVGPDLSLHGGIVSVVAGYLDAGLPEVCQSFDYLGTGVAHSQAGKALAFAGALSRYRKALGFCDIVHLHISAKGSYLRKSFMARMARRRGKKIVLHSHDGEFKKTFEEGDKSFRDSVRRTFGLADRVIVLSEEWRDYFAEHVCSPNKIDVLHNGVRVPPKATEPWLHQDILFLGRLDANKSPDVLLRASRRALEMFPNTRLVFGGDGALNTCKALARELGIADRCDFLGWVCGYEKEGLFERAGAYCLPSKNEGMPMSVLEAMAHGIPTVATAVGGIPQIVEHGVSGFLVGVDDEAALSDVLVRLMKSPELRTKIGAAGREKVAACFGIQASVKGLLEIYRKIGRARG